jgi:hypothetical protein
MGAIEVFLLGVHFFAPYTVPAVPDDVRCGPWIVAFFSEATDHPCRLGASGRISNALIQAVLVMGIGFVLALYVGTRNQRGRRGGGGEA